MEVFLGAYMFFGILLLILTIAWIIMPFALIGTKPLLRELIAQQKETNRLLKEKQATP